MSTMSINSILQPAGYGSYNIIIGNHGNRKTRLVHAVGHENGGVIYVGIPAILTASRVLKIFLQEL